MSCNPAIGGLGKGHLVREIDALDGLMGAGRRCGRHPVPPAQPLQGAGGAGPARPGRPQALPRRPCRPRSGATPNLEVIEAAVEDLIVEDGRVAGIVTADGRPIRAGAVVLTTGTFLRGADPSRRGEDPGRPPSASRRPTASPSACWRLDLRLGRLKTGTPARLDGAHDRLGEPGDAAGRRPAGAVLLPDRAHRQRRRSTAGSPPPPRRRTPSSAPTCTARRMYSGPDRQRRARATAPPSRTRWCASPTGPGTRSSWSPRAWTTTPSIPTASPPRSRPTCRRPSCAPFRGWRRWPSGASAMPSSTTTSIRASLPRRWR